MDSGLGSALESFYWLRFAGLAGLLAFAILRARRRWLNGSPEATAKRIIFPGLALILGFAIYLGLFTIVIAPILVLYVAAVVSFWVAVPAIASIAVVDLGAKLMQAERTGFWLAAGIIAYIAITFLWLSLIGIGPLLFLPALSLEFLALASVPAAAALIWWSYLPGAGGGSRIAETFE
jgi:hypothetical protein